MKTLSVNSARAIWLFNTQFLNPNGRYIMPAIAALAERYRFARLPEPQEAAKNPMTLKFEGGSFEGVDGEVFINLAVHNDGIIAETRSTTADAELFLEDALQWFASEFGLPHYSSFDIQRLYASELIVELNLPGSMFSPAFNRFLQRMQKGISNNPGVPMQPFALSFGPDPDATKKLAQFRIERLANTSFLTNHYYCAAPVPTEEHLELLQALEDATSPQ